MKNVTALCLVFLAAGCECAAPPVPPVGEGEGEGAGEGEGEGEGGEGEGEDLNACVAVDEGPGFAISAKADLRWKRVTPLQNDLMQALSLDEQDVCSELGLDGFCFQLIHLVTLGGNDPVKSAMYRPVAEPGVTTPLAFERVVLSACGRRADVDASVGAEQRALWKNIDLQGAGLADDEGMRADVTLLYRRMLARDPTAEELDLVVSLREDVSGAPVSGRDFAKMACFAVATTSENLFH